MKKLPTLLVVVLFALGSATALFAADAPGEVTFSPKIGTVTFNHQAHQALTDCATCHHTGDTVACRSCHGTDPQAPKAKDAFHTQCKNCHSEMKQGPTKCKECHIK